MKKIVNISDIKISESFLSHPPKCEKIEKKKHESFDEAGNQIRAVKLNKNNVLINGYATLLAAKELGYKKVWAKGGKIEIKNWTSYENKSTVYIFGVHPNSNCKKEFCWRLPNSWKGFEKHVEVGDTILCNTKFGRSPIVVTKIETLDKPPVECTIKKVAKREIRRNGVVVEL